jgi:cbb3-type cytochrome c oxidase subunit III
MIRKLILVGLLFAPTFTMADSVDDCGAEAKACLKYGAKVFQARCSLCHGSDGLGEGILPLSLKNYPSTNLLDPKHSKDIPSIREVVIKGASMPGISAEMPPWGDELTMAQLESVVMFVDYMRKDLVASLSMLRTESESAQPSIKIGRAIFAGRCSLCHGALGQGDGKMSRIIKDPPPFNLTLSRAPDSYLRDIITKGGAAMSRSPRMPPWGGDLTASEIDSVILYIKTLRQ